MSYQYGLTELEVKAMQVIEFAPLENTSLMAKQAKIKTNSLAASVRRLKEKNIIKLEAIYNPFAVGSLPVAVYGQLLEKDDSAKKSLMERMFKSPNITYIYETLGQYNFYFSIIVENLNSIPCIMRDLFESHGDIFSGKLISPRLEFILYPKKFLGSSKTIPHIICLSPKSGLIFKPDELDRAILDQVCNSGFESFRQVAKVLSEPASTIERRIKRLREHNVISGFRYAINRESLKTQHARLLLSKKGFCGDTNDRILSFCAKHPHITRITRAVGAWDYEISVEVGQFSEISSIVSGFHELCGVRLSHIEVVTELKMILKRQYSPVRSD